MLYVKIGLKLVKKKLKKNVRDTTYTTADGKLLKVQKSFWKNLIIRTRDGMVGNWGPTGILVILRIQVHERDIS